VAFYYAEATRSLCLPAAYGNPRSLRPQVDQFAVSASVQVGTLMTSLLSLMTAPADRDMPDDLGTNLAGVMVP